MKPRHLVVHAIAAATLGASSMSFAQGHPQWGQRYEAPRAQHVDHRRDDRRDHRVDHRLDFRHANRGHYYHNARGPEFRRGHYMPREYRHRQYVVTDYRSHRLYAPPRGHQWVQVGSDYVLMAIATGLIAHLVLSR